jgi:glycosyltransferase involved in cell wall biosynthesis
MKVLHLIKTDTGANWAFKQIKELSNSGIEIVVVMPNNTSIMAKKYEEINVKVIPANIDFPAKKIWKLPKILMAIRNIVKMENPDIIHSHFVGTTYTMRLALGKRHNVPRIFQVPGPLHLEKGPYGFIDLYTSGLKDYWVGSCQWTCDKYLSFGIPKNRIYRSYYGTSTEDFLLREPTHKLQREYKIPGDVDLIGMVAYMYPPKKYLGQYVGIKGHEDFIKAIAIVKKNKPNIKGVIIGGPWGNAETYVQNLKKLATRICGDSIIFTGFRNDVPEIYPDLSVVVHPSLSENLGGAAESLLAMVPTISTNIGGFPDIVIEKKTGWVVPPNSPEKIANAILKVLSNPSESKKIASNGREFVKEILDVNKTSAEILEIYKTILEIK